MKSRLNLLAIIATAFVVSGIAQAAAPKANAYALALKATKEGTPNQLYIALDAFIAQHKGKGFDPAHGAMLYNTMKAILKNVEAPIVVATLEKGCTILELSSLKAKAQECRALLATRTGGKTLKSALKGTIAKVSQADLDFEADLASAMAVSQADALSSAAAPSAIDPFGSAAAASHASTPRSARSNASDKADLESPRGSHTASAAPASAGAADDLEVEADGMSSGDVAAAHAAHVQSHGATAAGSHYPRPASVSAAPARLQRASVSKRSSNANGARLQRRFNTTAAAVQAAK